MKPSRSTLWVPVAFSLGSLIGLLLLGAALTDLWHMYGPREAWTGTELGKAEWCIATTSFWWLVIVHVAGVGVGARGVYRSRRTGS